MNYSRAAELKPAFTFRYGLWNEAQREWDFNREFKRKLDAANSPEEFILFPYFYSSDWRAPPSSVCPRRYLC